MLKIWNYPFISTIACVIDASVFCKSYFSVCTFKFVYLSSRQRSNAMYHPDCLLLLFFVCAHIFLQSNGEFLITVNIICGASSIWVILGNGKRSWVFLNFIFKKYWGHDFCWLIMLSQWLLRFYSRIIFGNYYWTVFSTYMFIVKLDDVYMIISPKWIICSWYHNKKGSACNLRYNYLYWFKIMRNLTKFINTYLRCSTVVHLMTNYFW